MRIESIAMEGNFLLTLARESYCITYVLPPTIHVISSSYNKGYLVIHIV